MATLTNVTPQFSVSPDESEVPKNLRGGVVAIGNFDGLHRGHQAVLATALEAAKKKNLPALLLTFEPHPRSFFNPKEPVFRLTPPAMKAQIAGHLGFDGVCVAQFNAQFSGLSANEFVEEILIKAIGASHVVTGHDFHFGSKRSGTPELLAQTGKDRGFGVSLVDAFTDEGGTIISSSGIRKMLQDGDISGANALLGYNWRFKGEVVEGQQLGRTLGYPTANILLDESVSLAHGIYAVRVELEDGKIHDGVASFGRRPTFDNGKAIFETYLFDFEGDLYGNKITVILHARLREELKFDSADALVEQMKRDEAEARSFLQTLEVNKGLWPLPIEAMN